MDLVFQNPWAAVLLGVLPLVWWRTAHVRLWQRLLRTALLAFIVMALTAPVLVQRSVAEQRVVVMDQRALLDAAQRAQVRERVRQQLRTMPPEATVTVLQLGGEPSPLGDAAAYRVLPAASPATALQAALEALPAQGGGHIHFAGSVRSEDGHWGRAVAALAARNIVVTVDPVADVMGGVRIVDLGVEPVRSAGRSHVQVQLEGQGEDLRVVLFRDAVEVARSSAITVHGPQTVLLSFDAGAAGFHALRAELQHAAGGDAMSVLQATQAVQDPLSLLFINADPAAGAHLQQLLGEGFAVRQHAPTAMTPSMVHGNDLAVMEGVGVETLAGPVQQALVDAVNEQGMGLVFSGGSAAFASLPRESDAAGALARLLPVRGEPKEQLQDPSVALVVIIDSSGSMAGAPMDLAKQVARLAVRRLKPEDRVGVVEFYGARQWSVPIQPARDTGDVERAIGRMQAQGGTQLFPAIQEAYFGLKNTDARFKHMLVITDAGVEDDNYQRLLRHIAQDRINVSTVLVGDGEGEQRMAELANWGRGRFYQVGDESSMVELNLKQQQLQPMPAYRPGQFALQPRPGQRFWQPGDFHGMPALQGISTALPQEGAEVAATAGDAPAVVTWQHGAGRVTALLTEPLGAGTRSWQAWPGYGGWLARLLVGAAQAQTPLALHAQRHGDVLQVTVQRAVTAGVTPPALSLVDAQGRAVALPLQARAGGLWQALVPIAASQDAHLLLRDGERTWRLADRAWSDSAPTLQQARYNLPLQALAQRAPSTAPANASWRAHELGTLLALLAIALYLFEVLCRRWPWSPLRLPWMSR